MISTVGLEKAGLLLPHDLRVLADGLLDHPECVAWCPLTSAVYCGGESGQIYRGDLDTGAADQIAQVDGGFICGVWVDGAGAVIACDVANGRVWRVPPGGDPAPYGDPVAYPNYPVLDADGVLWVSDSGHATTRPTAAWSGSHPTARPGGSPSAACASRTGWRCAAAGSTSSSRRGRRSCGSTCRTPATRRQVVVLPGTVPDGLAFDADGGLWISCCRPNRVYRSLTGRCARPGRGRLERVAPLDADEPRFRRPHARPARTGEPRRPSIWRRSGRASAARRWSGRCSRDVRRRDRSGHGRRARDRRAPRRRRATTSSGSTATPMRSRPLRERSACSPSRATSATGRRTSGPPTAPSRSDRSLAGSTTPASTSRAAPTR